MRKGSILLAFLVWGIFFSVNGVSKSYSPLSEVDLQIKHFAFSPYNAEEYALKDRNLNIYFRFSTDLKETFPNGSHIKADLSGPGINESVQSENNSDYLSIDGSFLPVKGEYSLSNIRLVSDSGEIVYSNPSSLQIHILDKIISTSVQTELLSLEEMEALGVDINDSNYTGYNIGISIAFNSEVKTINIPIVLPFVTQTDEASYEVESGFALVEGIQFPTFPISSGGGGGEDGTFDGGDGGSPDNMSIPSFIYFPSKVGYLHNFFKAVLIVINTTPEDAGMNIENLTATITLPAGRDGSIGSPELPGDDPLRIAVTNGDAISEKMVMNVGPDGEAGTSDDTDHIASGETGIAFFVVESLKEGSHTIDFEFEGNLDINGHSEPISGLAEGKILVRNPEMSVNFNHPDVIRENMPYELVVTMKNTSSVTANYPKVEFEAGQMVGGIFVDDNDNPLNNEISKQILNADGLNKLEPGEVGIVSFSVLPLITGGVVATYVRTEAGTAYLSLRHGVDDRGVSLSPDTLVLSNRYYSLPSDYRKYMDLLFGDIHSIYTDPDLPENVLPVSGAEYDEFAAIMNFSGLYYSLGDSFEDILIRNCIELRNSGAGIEQAIRTSYAGGKFIEKETEYLQQMILQNGLNAFAENMMTSICDSPMYHMVLFDKISDVSVLEQTSGYTLSTDMNSIPGAQLYLFDSNKGLILLPYHQYDAYRIQYKTTAPNASFIYGKGDVLEHYILNNSQANSSGKIEINGHVRALMDSDSNGQYETELSPNHQTVTFPSLSLMKVRQLDSAFLPNDDFKFGHFLIALFNRAVDISQAENEENYLIGQNSVLGVKAQRRGRAFIIKCEKPMGHFIERELTIQYLQDQYHRSSVSNLSQAIEMSDIISGYLLEGKVYNSDGFPLKNQFFKMEIRNDLVALGEDGMTFYSETDDDGYYIFDQIPFNDFVKCSSNFTIVNGNKIRRPRVSGAYSGQRIYKNIFFTGTGDVLVTVVDKNGIPIQDATISLNHHVELYNRVQMSDDEGQAVFNGVHMGPFTVHAVKQITGSQQIEQVYTGISCGNMIKKGSTVDVVVQLENKTGTVKGQLLQYGIDFNGSEIFTPIRHQAVVVYAKFDNTGGGSGYTESTGLQDGQGFVPVAWQYSAKDGSFEFVNIPSGEIYLSVSTDHSYYEGAGKKNMYLLQENNEINVTLIKKESHAKIFGTVTLGNGNPVQDTRVDIKNMIHNVSFNTKTDSQGHYVFENLPVGEYIVVSSLSQFFAQGTADILMFNQESECNLQFDPFGRIEGFLFESDGVTPAANCRVVIPPFDAEVFGIDPITGEIFTTTSGRSSMTDQSGKFSFEFLELRSYKLSSVRAGNVSNAEVMVNEAGKTFNCNMKFLPAGIVKGRVVQADGETGAVSKVTINSTIPSEDKNKFGYYAFGQSGVMITDDNGEFEFPVVNAGKVVVKADNVFASESSMFETHLNTEGQIINVVLRLGEQHESRIGGRIYLPDGRSLPGSGVNVTISGGGFPTFQMRTNSESEFETPDILPGGSYHIIAREPESGFMGSAYVMLPNNMSVFKDIRLKGYGNSIVSVKDETGNPVQSGIMTFQQQLPDGTTERRSVMYNNPDGTFEFDRVYEGDFAVSVLSSDGLGGRASGFMGMPGDTVDVMVIIESAGTIKGQVVEPDGITPAGDVELTLYSRSTRRPVGYTTTSLDLSPGEFEFDNLPLGEYVLVCFDVINGRFGQQEFRIANNLEIVEKTVTLVGAGNVQGDVMYADGSPAAQIPINIKSKVDLFGESGEVLNYSNIDITTLTDSEGHFSFLNIPLSDFELYARDDETGISGAYSGVLDENGQTVDCQINLVPSGSVKVKVVDYYGNALPYSKIKLKRTPFELENRSEYITLTSITDEYGMAEFNNIPSGVLVISAQDAKGFQVEKVQKELHTQGEIIDVTLKSPGRGDIFGNVYFSDGSIVNSGTIYLVNRNHTFSRRVVINDGAYIFENVVFDEYELNVTFNTQKKTVSVVLTEDLMSGKLDIFLNPTGTVRGVVLDADGSVVPFQSVRLYENGRYFGTNSTDENGEFLFTFVPYGDFSLKAHNYATDKKGFAGGLLNEDMSETYITIQLEGLGNISGTVVNKQGGYYYAPGMRVRYKNEETNYSTTVQVLGNGAFYFSNVPMGAYSLVYYDSYGFTYSDSGSLVSDGQVENHDFTIDGYCTVFGLVTDSEGYPVEKADVLLYGRYLSRPVRTNSTGEFEIPYVKYNDYTIKAEDLEKIHLASKTVSVQETENDEVYVALQFGDNIKIRGYVFNNGLRMYRHKVTDLESGLYGYTNKDGEYLIVLPRRESGYYQLLADNAQSIPLYGNVNYQMTAEENVDGNTVTMPDIYMEPSAKISGRLVSMDDNTPLSMRFPVKTRGRTTYVNSNSNGQFLISGLPLSEVISICVQYYNNHCLDDIVLTGDLDLGDIFIDNTYPTITLPENIIEQDLELPADIIFYYSDEGSGIDLSTLQILFNRVNITSQFTLTDSSATLHVHTIQEGFRFGSNSFQVEVKDHSGNRTYKYSSFNISKIPTYISGTVTLSDGSPVPSGNEVVLENLNTSEVRTEIIGENGSYIFNEVGFGEFRITVDIAYAKEAMREYIDVDQFNPEKTLQSSCYKYGIVSGNIKGEKYENLEQEPLTLDNQAELFVNTFINGKSETLTSLTDSEGHYEIKYLPLGKHTLEGNELDGTHVVAKKDLEIFDAFRERAVDSFYLAQGIVTGNVYDADGEKQTIGSISINSRYEDNYYTIGAGQDLTDNEPSFYVEEINQGGLEVTAHVGNMFGRIYPEITYEGQVIQADITLGANRTVTCRVVREDLTPVAGAEIRLYKVNYGRYIHKTVTDENGLYHIEYLGDYQHFISAAINEEEGNLFVNSEWFDFETSNNVDLGDLVLIPNEAPMVTITSINPENQVYAGNKLEISTNSQDDYSLSNLYLDINGCFHYEKVVNFSGGTNRNYTYTVTIPQDVDISYTNYIDIQVRITDSVGQESVSEIKQVEILKDTTPPAINLTFDDDTPFIDGHHFTSTPFVIHAQYGDGETGINASAPTNSVLINGQPSPYKQFYANKCIVNYTQFKNPLVVGENTISIIVTNYAGITSTASTTFFVDENYVLTGTVYDPSGNPVGAGYPLEFYYDYRTNYNTVTDENGEYRIDGILRGFTYSIKSDVPSTYYYCADSVKIETGVTHTVKDLYYYDYGIITGKVYRGLRRGEVEGTKHLYDKFISIYDDSSHFQIYDGEFTYSHKPFGTYTIKAANIYGSTKYMDQKSNSVEVTVNETTREQEIELFLPPFNELKGAILSSTGERVEGCRKILIKQPQNNEYRNYTSVEDAFDFSYVSDGTYEIIAIDESRNLRGSVEFTVEYDNEIQTQDIILEPSKSVIGRVLKHDGVTPAENAIVQVFCTDKNVYSAVTDAEGLFTVNNVYKSAFEFTVSHEDGYYGTTGDFSEIDVFDCGDITLGDSISDSLHSAEMNNSQITIPDSISLRPENLSIDFWIKPAELVNNNMILMKTSSANKNDGYGFYIQSDKLRFYINSYYLGNVDCQIDLNTWTHVAVTYDQQQIRMYINGELVTFREYSEPITHSASPLLIGSGVPYMTPYNGLIDNVRIWSKALNAMEISQSIAGIVPGMGADLAGKWDFDEGLGVNTYDSSQNSNDGVMSNGIYSSEHPDIANLSTFVSGHVLMQDSMTPASDTLVSVKFGNNVDVQVMTDTEGNFIASTYKGLNYELYTSHTQGHYSSNGEFSNINSVNLGDIDLMNYEDGHNHRALQLSSDWDRIEVPDNEGFRSEHISIDTWVKLDSMSNNDAIVVKNTDHNKNDGYGLYITNNKIRFYVNSYYLGYVEYPVQLGVWTHVAATYDGAELKLYFNGYLVASKVYSEPINHSSVSLSIGNGHYYGTSSLNGSIDELRIWNTAISQQTIFEALKGSIDRWSSQLVGYWDLNEGAGRFVNDVSGHCEDGILYGSQWTTDIPDLSNTLKPLTGKVISLSNNNNPIQGAEIQLTVLGHIFNAVSDANGEFVFENIPAGIELSLCIAVPANSLCKTITIDPAQEEIEIIAIDETPPVISVDEPLDGNTVTFPMSIGISYSDPDSGLDYSSLSIKVNGIESKDSFGLGADNATLLLNELASPFVFGSNTIDVSITNMQGLTSSGTLTFINQIPFISGRVVLPNETTPATGAIVKVTYNDGEIIQVTTAEDGLFKIENTNLNGFIIEISHGQGTKGLSGDFSESMFVELGDIVLDGTVVSENHVALSFDNNNDTVKVNFNESLRFTSVTAEAWVKTTDTEASIVGQTYYYGTGIWKLAIEGGYLTFGPTPTAKKSVNISDGQWHHVVGVFNSDSNRVIHYVDGFQVLNEGETAELSTTRTDALIVGSDGNLFRDMNGMIDEVRVWNRALTQREIHEHMSGPLQGNEDGLTVYFPFNENEGTQAMDASGNGNNGSITGAVWTEEGPDIAALVKTVKGTVIQSDGSTVAEDAQVAVNYTGKGNAFISTADDGSFLTAAVAGTFYTIDITHLSGYYSGTGDFTSDTTQDLGDLILTGSDGGANQYALSFDNNNDYVKVSFNDSLRLTSVTAEAWVKTTDTEASIVGQTYYYGTGIWKLAIEGGKLTFGPTPTAKQSVSISDGEWHHVAGVFNSATHRVIHYVDGIEVLNQGETAELSTTRTDALLIGSDGNVFRDMNGLIDEVRVWNRALTQREIHEHMSRQLQGNEEGLTVYFPFNQGSNYVIKDSSATVQYGQVVGPQWVKDVPDMYTLVKTVKGNVLQSDGLTIADNAQVVVNYVGKGNVFNTTIEDGSFLTAAVTDTSYNIDITHLTGYYNGIGDFTSGTVQDLGNIILTGSDGGANQYALSFDNNNDYVKVSFNESLRLTSVTAEAWVKTTDTEASIVGQTYYYGTGIWKLAIEGGKLTFGPTPTAAQSVSISDGEWHHVAGVFNSATNRVIHYVDGIEVLNLGDTAELSTTRTDALLIGSDGNVFRDMNGLIDEVRVWNRALTQREIHEHMSRQLQGDEEGLTVYFPFNQGSNFVIKDSSAVVQYGQVVGPQWVKDVPDMYELVKTVKGRVLLPDGITVAEGTSVNTVFGGVGNTHINTDLDGTFLSAAVNASSYTLNVTQPAGYFSEMGDFSVDNLVDTGDIVLTSSPGGSNYYSMHFDNNNDYVKVSYNSNLVFTSMTAEAWVKTTDTEASIVGQTYYYGTGIWKLAIEGGKLTFGPTPTAKQSVSISDGQWHHVVGVFDSTNDKVIHYVDGVEVLNVAETAELSTTRTDALLIGSDGNLFRDMNGYIDEVRVWNRVLTQEEIQTNMSRQLQGDEDGLTVYFPFIEGAGFITRDQSVNGMAGRIFGPTWSTDVPDLTVNPSTKTQCNEPTPESIGLTADKTSINVGDSLQLNVKAVSQTLIKEYALVATGTVNTEMKRETSDYSVNDVFELNIPEDASPGLLKVSGYAVDSTGKVLKTEPMNIAVINPKRDLIGKVVTSSGHPAVHAVVTVWTCEVLNDGSPRSTQQQIYTDLNGQFTIEHFFDISDSVFSYGYGLDIKYGEGLQTEVARVSEQTKPSDTVDCGVITLSSPKEADIQALKVNAEIPLFTGKSKPMIIEAVSAYDIVKAGVIVDGLFTLKTEENYQGTGLDHCIGEEDHVHFIPVTLSVPENLKGILNGSDNTIHVKTYVEDEFGRVVTSEPVTLNVMNDMSDLTGQVITSDSIVVADAEVEVSMDLTVVDENGEHPYSAVTDYYTLTDSTGHFILKDLIPLSVMSEETITYVNGKPELTVREGQIHTFTVNVSSVDAMTNKKGRVDITELPQDTVKMTLEDTSDPVVWISQPVIGFTASTHTGIPVELVVDGAEGLSITAQIVEDNVSDPAHLLRVNNEPVSYANRSGMIGFAGHVNVSNHIVLDKDSYTLRLTFHWKDTQSGESRTMIEDRMIQLSDSPDTSYVKIDYPETAPLKKGLEALPMTLNMSENVIKNSIQITPYVYGSDQVMQFDVETGMILLTHPDDVASPNRLRVVIEYTEKTGRTVRTVHDILTMENVTPITFSNMKKTYPDLKESNILLLSDTGEKQNALLTNTEPLMFKNMIISPEMTLTLAGDGGITCSQSLVVLPGAVLNGSEKIRSRRMIRFPEPSSNKNGLTPAGIPVINGTLTH